MCLLIAHFRCAPGAALILSGNRDELLDRPAVAMDVLGESPRVLGGRDLRGRGTWLAVSELGVVAALTNRPPSPEPGLEPSRSRGELPLFLTRHATAERAVAMFQRSVDPRDYGPCWLLVGDRTHLFYLELLAGDPVTTRALRPGVHVLENRPLEADSLKADHVRALLAAGGRPHFRRGHGLLRTLAATLADREIPPPALLLSRATRRPAALEAASVRAPGYGTRWSGIVAVSQRPGRPRFLFSDGPAGEAPFVRARWAQVSRVL